MHEKKAPLLLTIFLYKQKRLMLKLSISVCFSTLNIHNQYVSLNSYSSYKEMYRVGDSKLSFKASSIQFDIP